MIQLKTKVRLYIIPILFYIPSALYGQGDDQTYPGVTWETRTPAQVGMDEAKLDAFRDYLGSRGCVVRSGKMIYTWGSQSECDYVFSAEKPWYAHFLWKALEDGKIPSLDQKVNIWELRLNEINGDLGYKDRNITWRHLANQTSCYGVRDNPGEAFNYNDYQMALFWDLLFLKVYGVTYENVDSTLLHPMLTDILQCQDNPTFMESGHSSQGSLGVSARDFARFGLLYLRQGNWQGNQLISAEHARTAVTSPLPATLPTSTEALSEVIDGQRTIGRVARVQKQGPHLGSYSWLWWVNGVDHEGNRNWPDAPADTYMASGGDGNRVAVIPSLDMVAVWLGVGEESRDINRALKLLVEGFQSGIQIQGDRFLLNGEPFDMWGIRTSSATMNQATTDHLIAQLEEYKAHGVNSVTVYYMGSSGGKWDPFSPDGKSIDSGHQARMKQIIEACAVRNMVVIVGIFYQHAPFGLKDAEAVRNAVRTVTTSLKPYKNVIINIANEQNSRGWEDSAETYDFRNTSNIIELCRVVHQEDPDRLVGGGGYDHDKNEIIGKSSDVDILLFDTAGDEDSGPLYNRFVSAGISGKPIVNVELFGSWSKNPVKGVYPDYKKQRYCDEIDRAVTYGGLSVFFHSNTWCQEPPLRYDLGGQGTSSDPGIRWYFDYAAKQIKCKLLSGFSYSQTVFSWQEDNLILDNGAIKRTIEFNREKQTVQTRSVFHGKNDKNYISENSSLEFSFEIDGVTYTGQDKWEYVKHVASRDHKQGEGVTVTIRGTGELSGLEIDIIYLLYPDLPLIRKQLTFRNKGEREFKLESLDIESLAVNWGATHSWVYTNYARQKHLGTYVGNWDDPLVVVHDYRGRKGIALGNEAPGVTKRTAYHTVYDDVSIGLTHSDENYAFRKWIEPNEEWTSPEVFIATYDNSPDASNVINSTVNDFTRKHMGIRLMEIKEKPVFVYNTWNPFRHNINEQLIKDLADAAAECGIEEFIIDDGWQRNFNPGKDRGGPVGDWLINETKFPNGLSPVFNYMKEKGLKPGLWISIGSAHESAKVYADHEEWFVKDKEGNLANLHSEWDSGLRTSCFSTDWPDYIKSKIIGLVKDHGLEYTKLDFAIVTSAYMVNPDRSGCYATNHPYHKDHNESFLNNYQRLLNLFDDLHNEAPDLFIDCTFETVGKLQLIDYATVKHAEGDWLSNFEAPSPFGALRVRNMAWWRTPVIPAGACVIGNLILDSKDLEFDLLSLVGTLPIMLGDPRKLSDNEREMLKSWSTWLRKMQERYNYMVYRQDLPCFGEPTEGHWDGWARINTDTQEGGIIGVFRQGAIEKSRLITINWLKADQKYAVINARDGDILQEMTGDQLKNEGFRVSMEREYQGKIFEIKKID